MHKNIKHINYFILTFALVLFSMSTNAQEVRVIDNKGTIQSVNNNNVYSQNLDPVTNAPLITPVENDIWINTTPTPDQAKIWDGTNWVDLTLNVYNIDGILSNNRTVDGSASEFDLTFRSLNGRFTSSSRFDIDNIDLVLFSSLTNFTVQNSNRAMFSGLNQFTIQTTANVSLTSTGPFSINAANTTLSGNIVVPGTYTATSGGVGTANQILSSTGTGTQWVNATALFSNIYTADGTLTGSRTLTGASNSLTFSGLNTFTTNTLGATTINSDGATIINATGGLQVNDNQQLNGNLDLNGTLLANNGAGTSGQVLTSTGAGVQWENNQKNTVTTSDTPPTTPIEDDIWFETDTTTPDHTLIKIYNGTNWVELVPKTARVFYPPSIVIDASTTGAKPDINLYNEYFSQFSGPAVKNPSAPNSIPTYSSGELYYYITDYDTNVLTITGITDAGVMSYSVDNIPPDDNTIINVVFVVK